MSMKNPVTPAGIEPAAVAQHLNHCATADPNVLKSLHFIHLQYAPLSFLRGGVFKYIHINFHTLLLQFRFQVQISCKLPAAVLIQLPCSNILEFCSNFV